MAICEHLLEADDPPARTPDGCEECLAMGARWVHLRRCLDCGHIGCCDSSPNKHATAHFRAIGHPVMQSFEPGEHWKWCFVDNTMG
ncbi:UBP-type zinc finger domain-containing protein [Nonomuraea sp. NPDC049152]|uniref:ubiquitin carboxyl-terminal hydrolase 14 n=1 Tax=Nonomuraea sp. NPDC049152 TaxID=3154350 RepID=UPI0033EB59FE